MRSKDVVARYGGEEFAIMLPNAGQTIAGDVAENVRAVIESTVMSVAGITVSVGFANTIPAKTTEAGPLLIAHADRALYEAKRRGRNRAVSYDAL